MTMPNSPIAQQALEAAQGLGERIRTLTDHVEQLDKSNKELTDANKILAESNTRHRHWILALGVIGSLIAAVVVGLVIALVKVDRANDKAVDAAEVAGLVQQYLEQTCEAGNDARALEAKLWNDLITADEEIAELEGYEVSPEERRALDEVRANVANAYPQRDCTGVQEGEVRNATPTPGR